MCLTYPYNCMYKTCKEIQGLGGRQLLVPSFVSPDFCESAQDTQDNLDTNTHIFWSDPYREIALLTVYLER